MSEFETTGRKEPKLKMNIPRIQISLVYLCIH